MSIQMRLYQRLPAPARSVAATLRGLYLRAWRYGPRTDEVIEEALEREHWSTEQWRAWREEQLVLLLERAATRVPYYRDQWAARRRRGDRASWSLLENWPVLEKETLRECPLAFVAEDRDLGQMFHERTSGTTGKPLDLWRTRSTVQELYAIAHLRTREWNGVSRGDRFAMLGGQLVVPVVQRRPPFWVWNAALHQLYMSTYHLAPDLVPAYLDALARYRITYLYGYPSSLLQLALGALSQGRTDLRMRVVITNAEPLTAEQRCAIGEAFGCPVRETYGMAEMVSAASECPHGRLHQWPEVGVVELLDGDGPVGPGETGDIVGTGLLNVDMPLVRYRVGDRGRVGVGSSLCTCGRTLPLFARVEGRVNDVLVTRDGRRVTWLNPVFYGLPVSQSQIVQEALDRVHVRFVPAAGYSTATGETIVARLAERLGPDVHVTLETVTEVPRTANGKFRAVECRVPAAELRRIAGVVLPPGVDTPAAASAARPAMPG